ncbi:MAG: ornithine cyclodeaminase family protein [Mesorhizobium sp.]|uniref:ornithine cyclodeaminase family protein n=1 Tax=Mesorhizobium sp. M1E.F.Ca.ET.045.02.1.1 TaxID=2493672 RepID=UPI000F74EB6D|nr:ornithine cyclodeaminase family protein [Mesorhizobium sp. M1E.F.Ca.ET.045.02.1.1]AZO19819.1 ornithine cyclodeaminase family protein [Mesorhizobium sp. M1E.F.Ca.ET.045.02.1.1]TIU34536.1 MAG: ornithine cyclodeaminase family protein [Mesorhizobium sp.]TKB16436.1 MAG: ornithine cyclodeaminase family protein [Mesorhizobium sp.]
MLVISETLARDLVAIEEALEAVEQTFSAMARGLARNYPVVREVVGYADAVFGVKTGADNSVPFLGLKAGGYWPHNLARGLTNHQSSTLLFDPDTGRASALVSANYLTGIRTGAASAIATKHLSRPDCESLGIIGTGTQSVYQLKATLAVRSIKTVHAWDPSPDNLAAFGKTVAQLGIAYRAHKNREDAVRLSDILVTVTPSTKPLVEREWVVPGTHISAMGADTRGKQELDSELVSAAALFVDEIAQSLSIGEFQHAYAQGMIGESDIRGSIGAVIAGMAEGRRSADEITIFDGTGVSLQDLVVADLAVRRATERGLGSRVEF